MLMLASLLACVTGAEKKRRKGPRGDALIIYNLAFLRVAVANFCEFFLSFLGRSFTESQHFSQFCRYVIPKEKQRQS